MRRNFGPICKKSLLKPLMTAWLIFGLFSLHIAPEFLHSLVHILERSHHAAVLIKPTALPASSSLAFQNKQEFCQFNSVLANHLQDQVLSLTQNQILEFPTDVYAPILNFKKIYLLARLYK